jgi:hypothetical protein
MVTKRNSAGCIIQRAYLELKRERIEQKKFQKLIEAVTTIQRAFRFRRELFGPYSERMAMKGTSKNLALDLSMIVFQQKLNPLIPKWKANNYIKKSARIIQSTFRSYRIRRELDFLSYNSNIIEAPRILFLKDQKNVFKRMIKIISAKHPVD